MTDDVRDIIRRIIIGSLKLRLLNQDTLVNYQHQVSREMSEATFLFFCPKLTIPETITCNREAIPTDPCSEFLPTGQRIVKPFYMTYFGVGWNGLGWFGMQQQTSNLWSSKGSLNVFLLLNLAKSAYYLASHPPCGPLS